MKIVKFAGKWVTEGGEIVHCASWPLTIDDAAEGTHRNMGKPKKKCLRCDDCYFKQNMLCALKLDAPCPTFRSAERGLRPERQLAFVFRADRTCAAYAFPPAHARTLVGQQ